MKHYELLFIILSCYCIFACVSQKQIATKPQIISSGFVKKQLTNTEWQDWQHKDIAKDSIAGISLDKAYECLKNIKGDTVLVAVLDTRLIKGNEDLKNLLWTNKDEIPNNNIDDDKNGYIDDIHGWNFLGNKNGAQEYRANFEFVRVIRKFDPLFKGKKRQNIKDTVNYDIYTKAKRTLQDEIHIVNQNILYLDSVKALRSETKKELSKFYPDISLDVKVLDSMLRTEKDSTIIKKIIFLKEYDSNKQWYVNRYKRERRHLEIYYNKDYKERSVIKDNSNDLTDINYGNPTIFSDSIYPKHTHSIKVVSVLAANRTNNYGIKGVTNSSKIMMVTVSPFGDEHDKDIALGIRYAVDNGAKIINITFTKYFSLHSDWVREAIKYASRNNVLIVCSAGNYSKNLDNETPYPNDTDTTGNEVVDNLMMIGSSTPFANEFLVSDYSNYGKKNVDIFAPGEFIYTSIGKNNYNFTSGTSYSAPIVSGIAALIRSHYPNLTAAEVKQIIMKSGVSYDIMVNKPSTSKEKELVPFSSLSKSGKIVNAYNALLMAEEVSKKKKKRN
ncbi:S8 family serine peptidase [Kordia sp.]|uniref:S8 family serine peptidase n=1 Tax=Kordia sp. TaxID=1965332 RepID=UPI003B5C3E72